MSLPVPGQLCMPLPGGTVVYDGTGVDRGIMWCCDVGLVVGSQLDEVGGLWLLVVCASMSPGLPPLGWVHAFRMVLA